MKKSTYPIGTMVIAIKNIGPVKDGQPGIVTGYAELGSLLWKRPAYLCTFLGNVKVAMSSKEIDDFAHGYSRVQIESSDGPNISPGEQLRRVLPDKK